MWQVINTNFSPYLRKKSKSMLKIVLKLMRKALRKIPALHHVIKKLLQRFPKIVIRLKRFEKTPYVPVISPQNNHEARRFVELLKYEINRSKHIQ